MVLNQFDPAREALFNACDVVSPIPGFPKTLVTCFAHNLIEYAVEKYPSEIVDYQRTCNEDTPIYRVRFGDCELGLTMNARRRGVGGSAIRGAVCNGHGTDRSFRNLRRARRLD